MFDDAAGRMAGANALAADRSASNAHIRGRKELEERIVVYLIGAVSVCVLVTILVCMDVQPTAVK